MKIAFDIDDTLIVPSVATGLDRDTPNYETIAIYRWFQAQGHYMILWSGSGTDWAKTWGEKLGLLPNEIRVKQKSEDVDIAFDDCEVNLANVNIQVKRLNNSISRKIWNKTKHPQTMTPNNPELSSCCQAPLKDFPDMRDGQTVPVICSKCEKDCSVYVPYESVRRLPEQTEPEPTQKLGWEEEFDSLPRHYGKVVCGQDNPMMQQDSIKAFIRKVEKEAYERGEASMLARCIARLEENHTFALKWDHSMTDIIRRDIETLKSLLTNPKDK